MYNIYYIYQYDCYFNIFIIYINKIDNADILKYHKAYMLNISNMDSMIALIDDIVESIIIQALCFSFICLIFYDLGITIKQGVLYGIIRSILFTIYILAIMLVGSIIGAILMMFFTTNPDDSYDPDIDIMYLQRQIHYGSIKGAGFGGMIGILVVPFLSIYHTRIIVGKIFPPSIPLDKVIICEIMYFILKLYINRKQSIM